MEGEKIGQDQFHSFVFDEKLSWQEIIYDLINSEQLDPWNIDISILSQKYLEKIRELEEADFILSSKVLLIASLMLRIKSELLMNHYIKNLDDVLFGKKEEIQKTLETIDFDEGDIPELLPRTPLPRFKKIGINELMNALNQAITTETRREIKKKDEKEAFEQTQLYMPKKTISLSQRVKGIHGRVKEIFTKQEKIKFTEFSGPKRQDKIDNFFPLLHLDNHGKIWLQQNAHLEDIWIHKNGDQFIEQDEIITNKIEGEFEDSLKKNN